jgi:hypothetical protein
MLTLIRVGIFKFAFSQVKYISHADKLLSSQSISRSVFRNDIDSSDSLQLKIQHMPVYH